MDDNETGSGTDTETTTTTEKTMDELLNMPYADMTEDELARVIDYKAEQKALSTEYTERKAAAEALDNQILTEHQSAIEIVESQLQSMADSALDRLNRASKGELV